MGDVAKERALEEIEYLANVAGSETEQDAINRIARYIRKSEAAPEGMTLDSLVEFAFREGHQRGQIDGSGFESDDWRCSDSRAMVNAPPEPNQ